MAVRLLSSAALALLLLGTPRAARAEFGTTDFQLLQGYGFHDALLGYDTQSGTMTTITIDHFSTWAAGDNFFFVDLYRGSFRGTGLGQSNLYGEWHPRLFLNKLGLPTGGIIKNWGLAGEVNQGPSFYAYLGGLGLDLAIPGFTVAGLNLYYRYDEYEGNTFQISPFWTVPFALGPTHWIFTGFVDVTTTVNGHLDVMAQPELLVDVGTYFGAPNRLHVGVEWYLHTHEGLSPTNATYAVESVPQAMVQWTAF